MTRLHRQQPQSPALLFVPRLTPQVVTTCRSLGINCADTDGNMFIRSATSVVDISGRPISASRELAGNGGGSTRAISRSGLQIIFVLLSDPDYASAPYRAIADAAAVSLGSVATVLRELDRDGHIGTQPSGGRTLRRTSELLDRWTGGYRVRLYAKLQLGRFTTDETTWWTTSGQVIRDAGGQWGGETALWAQRRGFRPAHGVVYLDRIAPAMVAALRLARVPQNADAPVDLRRRFWNVSQWSSHNSVPSALVYADLLSDGDPRLVEAASNLRANDVELKRLDEH